MLEQSRASTALNTARYVQQTWLKRLFRLSWIHFAMPPILRAGLHI